MHVTVIYTLRRIAIRQSGAMCLPAPSGGQKTKRSIIDDRLEFKSAISSTLRPAVLLINIPKVRTRVHG